MRRYNFIVERGLSVRPIQSYSGPGARFETWLLWLVGVFLRPFAYRGIGTLSRHLGRRAFRAQNHVVVPLFRKSLIDIELGDYYWSRLLFADFEYEPEVARVLAAYLKPDSVFLDLGANIGYWSIFASEIIADPKRIVTVEGGHLTFERLSRNAAINHHPFTAIHGAVAARAGETVSFVTEGGHAGARIAGSDERFKDTQRTETVATCSIDALMAAIETTKETPVVIKLDVEGAEVPALMGAKETLRRTGILIIYEDHGADRDCTVSRHVIEDMGFDVYMIDGGGPPVKATLDAIAASKTDPLKGYNFVAVPPGAEFSLD